MKFRFPIVIIDEDFRSENASGLGIRALASAIEKEGMEVLGVTSYGDLSQFAQQQSRASAFILSIDDEEFAPGLYCIGMPFDQGYSPFVLVLSGPRDRMVANRQQYLEVLERLTATATSDPEDESD